jgi:glycyl-tRNA synthetase beta chain
MIPDEGLLAEVSGLAEWPVVHIARIPEEFMELPSEILQTSMRTHQKYFSLRNLKTGKMDNHFALVANMITEDGGKEIVAGNERVLRARLSDAKFFWDEDRKKNLDERVETLEGVVFHAQLGTQLQRVERIQEIAAEIAIDLGADSEKAKRAAWLAKADLTSGVVGEFPELQGAMGRYYALHFNEDIEVADAIRDHYKPAGTSDALPEGLISVAVAIADKIDSITNFFWIDERPTGSGDPYALRRSALGIIRIVLQYGLRLSLRKLINLSMWSRINAWDNRYNSVVILGPEFKDERELDDQGEPVWKRFYSHVRSPNSLDELVIKEIDHEIAFIRGDMMGFDGDEYAAFFEGALLGFIDPAKNRESVVAFFADRLKVALKEKGVRHDLIDAVFSIGHEDDLVRLVARVEALEIFLKDEDGANLLAAYRRAVNILKIEEKKDDRTYEGEQKSDVPRVPEEERLLVALQAAQNDVAQSLKQENFIQAMAELSGLREFVDAFFDKVKVNAEDKQVRENRLNLLASLRATLHQVADFSRIEG